MKGISLCHDDVDSYIESHAIPFTASHSSLSSPSGSCTTFLKLPLPSVASANCLSCQLLVPFARFCGWNEAPLRFLAFELLHVNRSAMVPSPFLPLPSPCRSLWDDVPHAVGLPASSAMGCRTGNVNEMAMFANRTRAECVAAVVTGRGFADSQGRRCAGRIQNEQARPCGRQAGAWARGCMAAVGSCASRTSFG